MDALSHLRVLDLTRVRAGPTCVKQFADWGADVIRIEPSGEGQDMLGERDGSDAQNLHRNKRSLRLNLKDPRGVDLLKRLVAGADVLVENWRPAVKHRLGIDYETLAALNPRLVYASISGFGETGPYSDRAGFDQVAQGMGGLMAVTGKPGDGPLRAGTAIADLGAGLFAALGILIALEERQRSGRGQWVQSSLLGAMIALMDFQAARWLVDGVVPGQAGNDHPTTAPTGVYPTADGFVNIGAVGNAIYARLCTALGAPELATRPDFATTPQRVKHRAALNAELGARTRLLDTATVIERLNAAGVPCGPIYTMDQVFADPQVRHLGLAAEVPDGAGGSRTLVGPPVKLSRTPARMRRTQGPAGEHNEDILRDLGLTAAEIGALRNDKVI
jgi:crotonobetainyl-CoA:carnitine CoA-transferase CaiB-like acyl-CoA transferase